MDDQIRDPGDKKTRKRGRRIVDTEGPASLFHEPFPDQRVAEGPSRKSAPAEGDKDDRGVEGQDGGYLTEIDEPAPHDEAAGKGQLLGTESIQETPHDGGGYARFEAVDGEGAGDHRHAPGEIFDDGLHECAEAVIENAGSIG